MTTAKVLTTHHAVVAMDYGQFSLVGTWGDGDYMQALDEALAGDHFAGNGDYVLICSPHQNNFTMPLEVEVWDGRPPDDQAGWDEVFESALVVSNGSVSYQSPTLRDVSFPVQNGRYALRICGRGFVNRGWPGSTTPADSWRVQLWPSTDPVGSRRLKAWQPPASA